MVRAKFFVTSIAPFNPANESDGYTIELEPVHDGSPDNRDFYKWTPGGKITLSTVNVAAAKEFGAGSDFYGKEFYVDFSEAPAT